MVHIVWMVFLTQFKLLGITFLFPKDLHEWIAPFFPQHTFTCQVLSFHCLMDVVVQFSFSNLIWMLNDSSFWQFLLVWYCFQMLCLYFHLFIAKIAKLCAVIDVLTVFWIAPDHTEVGKCNLSHFQIKQYRLQLIQSPLTRSAPRYALMMMMMMMMPQNQN